MVYLVPCFAISGRQTDYVEFDKVYITCQFQGNMDIDEGNHSEECNEETLEKMQVLVYKLLTGPTFTSYICNGVLLFLYIF